MTPGQTHWQPHINRNRCKAAIKVDTDTQNSILPEIDLGTRTKDRY